MPRTSRFITFASAALVCVCAPGAFAQSEDAEDRVFGRVGPERPVVEIPADQVQGVNPDAPLEGWEVHDPSRVIETEVPEATPPVDDASVDPALALIAPAANDGPMGPPAPERTAEAPAPETNTEPIAAAATQTEADPVVPYVAPNAESLIGTRPLGATEAEPIAAGDGGASKPWWGEMGQTAIALAVVIGLIVVLAYIYTRLARSRGSLIATGGARSPAGVLEVLGRYPMGPRQTMMIIKFDKRVLLVTQTTPRSGPPQMSTLCELVEPEDVASVLTKVRDASGDSMNETFRAAMDRVGGSAAPASNGSRPAPEFMPERVEPVAAVAEPKSGFDADYDPEDLRRTVGGTEEERAQLWEDIGTERPGRDPVGSLKRRLSAMRGGVPR
ncbi:MAG: hypothetical protein DHS20C14_13100 [Phycisphaeraceae bacterium]|nr:MAG: hypothetical protein DHS20C14_13100 [Phycisphaeraceae bacterium]